MRDIEFFRMHKTHEIYYVHKEKKICWSLLLLLPRGFFYGRRRSTLGLELSKRNGNKSRLA